MWLCLSAHADTSRDSCTSLPCCTLRNLPSLGFWCFACSAGCMACSGRGLTSRMVLVMQDSGCSSSCSAAALASVRAHSGPLTRYCQAAVTCSPIERLHSLVVQPLTAGEELSSHEPSPLTELASLLPLSLQLPRPRGPWLMLQRPCPFLIHLSLFLLLCFSSPMPGCPVPAAPPVPLCLPLFTHASALPPCSH